MDGKDRMPKVNIEVEGHKLTKVEKEYMQRIHKHNIERVEKWTKIQRKNRYLGISLGIGVLSIYSYTLWAIKQESFLDDFNEPEKTNG